MTATKLGSQTTAYGLVTNLVLQVSIVALKDGQIEIVQASMLGSILSNLLLVMGMCFLFGGLVHRGRNGAGTEQSFSAAVAQTTCSLMTLSSASLVIPATVSNYATHAHAKNSNVHAANKCYS